MSYTLGLTSPLGIEPDTSNHLNGGSSQQDSIVSYNGYQYTGFWRDASGRSGCRQMVIARRRYEEYVWEEIQFTDYAQTTDDGHNTVCIGICIADGTIHAAFDMHDSPLNYRISRPDVITDPSHAQWDATSFGPTIHALPMGDPEGQYKCFQEVTYPRFVALTRPYGGLALEYRTGISGLGDCWLFVYTGDGSSTWIKRGKYLQGVENNPYLNGIDVDAEGALHVSWCYRDYVPATLKESQAQAGPNGPENNHDVMYAYSPAEADGSGPGLRWFVSSDTLVGYSDVSPIRPETEGALVFHVDKFSGGSLNQEAQCVDWKGNVHILNRERHEGVDHWYHYCRLALTKEWSRNRVPIPLPSYLSARGKLLSLSRSRCVALLLPLVPDLVIYIASLEEPTFDWREVSRVPNAGAIEAPGFRVAPNVTGGLEPAIDRLRAMEDDCISVFVGVTEEGVLRKQMKVMDFVPIVT